MAGTKISDLPELTTPTGDEELVYAYNDTNGKIKISSLGGGMGTPTLIASSNQSATFTADLSGYEWIGVTAYQTTSEQNICPIFWINVGWFDWTTYYHTVRVPITISGSVQVRAVSFSGNDKTSVSVSFNNYSDTYLYGL